MAPELRAALMETFDDPLRTQVYIAIYERPGATVSQVARRLDQPGRRVRHQVDRLINDGLVVVDAETPKRNVRERHHRGVVVPSVDWDDDRWSEENRQRMNLSLVKFIAADIGRAIRHRTFGARLGHAEVRVPGEVDGRGWAEIEATLTRSMEHVEATMISSAARLEASGETGIEVFSALLLFEARPWDPSADARQGPRPSRWTRAACGCPSIPSLSSGSKADGPRLADDLRRALIGAIEDQFRAHVLFAVVDRPGVTIGQIAARIGQPPRRVRHQVERLLEAGLILVDAETPRRNARERHYRGVALPTLKEEGPDWTDEQRRKFAISVAGAIMADLDGGIHAETFGTRSGHSVIRIPGEVDDRGWGELAASIVSTTERIEGTMVRSAARLTQKGVAGREVVSALLLFESPPWDPGEGARSGPRPTQWAAR
ncbi:MAG TPA: helix-turn-helix domain-containing protein [Solirubrobacterales bacterium]